MIMMAAADRDDSHLDRHANALSDSSAHLARVSPVSEEGEMSRAVPAGRAISVRDDESVDHVAEEKHNVVKVGKRQRIKNHCARFWLWWLIGTIVFLAIFLPILFVVIFPKIVQKLVDDQSLPISGGEFIVLSPDSMNVSITTSINTPLPAHLDEFKLYLYNSDTPTYSPFLDITLPGKDVKGDTEIKVATQTCKVTNETEIIKWFGRVFDQEKTTLSSRGGTRVHLGALKSDVWLDKTVEIPTLNNLKGFGIETLSLVLPPLENGTNVRGSINIPNWSKLTIGLGNLTLNLMSGGVKLGVAFIPDVVVPPGNKTFFMTGELYIKDAISQIGPVLEAQAEPLSRGMVRIGASGNQTIINGAHIPFVEQILNNKMLFSEMPVITLVSQVLGGLLGSGQGGLLDVIGDIVGNKTFVEEVLTKLNATGTLERLNATGTVEKLNLTAIQGAAGVAARRMGIGRRDTLKPVALDFMQIGLRLRSELNK